MFSPDPWELLAERFPDTKVYLRSDLDDRWGQTAWHGDTAVIYLAYDLGPIQRRCALSHEIQHLIRGEPCRSLCPTDEYEVRLATAAWLLPSIEDVGAALREHDVQTAAERLGVTRFVVLDRLNGMTAEETFQMGRVLVAGRRRPVTALHSVACTAPSFTARQAGYQPPGECRCTSRGDA